MSDRQVIIILCTVPNLKVADRVATKLIDQRLAACVNIAPGIISHYRWEKQAQRDNELLLIIKSTSARFSEVEAAIKALHPYTLPEIISIPISHGSTGYLDWIIRETDKITESTSQNETI